MVKRTRIHRHSITQKELQASPHYSLGGNWFVKKNKDENKFYLQMSSSVYQEMSPDCFKLTIEKSKHLPVEQMKQQLKQFEVNNEQKKN